MSFNDLKLTDLRNIADSFGVELPAKTTKKDLILILQEEGVSYEDYQKFAGIEKEEVELDITRPQQLEINNEETILVKMERNNFSYQIGPVTFTKDHPFMAVPTRFADEIFINHPGFRPATPREVQEFYS